MNYEQKVEAVNSAIDTFLTEGLYTNSKIDLCQNDADVLVKLILTYLGEK